MGNWGFIKCFYLNEELFKVGSPQTAVFEVAIHLASTVQPHVLGEEYQANGSGFARPS